jgi:hypothetical protein
MLAAFANVNLLHLELPRIPNQKVPTRSLQFQKAHDSVFRFRNEVDIVWIGNTRKDFSRRISGIKVSSEDIGWKQVAECPGETLPTYMGDRLFISAFGTSNAHCSSALTFCVIGKIKMQSEAAQLYFARTHAFVMQ